MEPLATASIVLSYATVKVILTSTLLKRPITCFSSMMLMFQTAPQFFILGKASTQPCSTCPHIFSVTL